MYSIFLNEAILGSGANGRPPQERCCRQGRHLSAGYLLPLMKTTLGRNVQSVDFRGGRRRNYGPSLRSLNAGSLKISILYMITARGL